MPISFNNTLNYAVNGARNLPIIENWSKSPLSVSILISVVVVLIILFVMRSVDFSDNDEGLLKLSVRAGIYSFLVILVIEFVQNHYLMQDLSSTEQSKQVNEMFSPGKSGIEPNIPVYNAQQFQPGQPQQPNQPQQFYGNGITENLKFI